MKTDELIALLARDATPVKRAALPMRIGMLALVGAVAAFVILVPWLGIRPDLAEAVTGSTYWMKTLYTLGVGVAGFALAERLSRPGAKGRIGWALAGFFAAAIVAIAASQIIATPPEQMRAALMGSSWDKCPWRILVLSLPGLAVILWAMRKFAPTRPALAGAAAGLLAGGIAATVYGLHCQEIAAPFVALWYSLGMILSAIVGSLIGSRLLRW
ncbi:MAG: DUF1109 family protein [Burkholderiales bacterium]|nr:MAG: DUF1109 family protein [Burkholderiales bacterium]